MSEDLHIVFRDFLMFITTALMVAVVFTLTAITSEQAKNEDQAPSVGNLVVEARWPDGMALDVDLWCRGPGDSRPVGYSNRGGELFSLIRDDLGNIGDRTPANYENCITRGIEEGHYIINVHAYGGEEANLPVSVKVRVVLWKDNKLVPIYQGETRLEQMGQEATAVQFDLDNNQGLVAGSLRTDFEPLRSSFTTQQPQPSEEE